MLGYCGLRPIGDKAEGYCANCHAWRSWKCDFPCDAFLNYLSVLSECLNGKPIGVDPCYNCPDKGEWNCVLYGVEKPFYEQLQFDLPTEIGGAIDNS